ncbi:hypothetical protein [Actibacterium sp. 188UL27-1]|uniref:hypothetical protein n=1 Tax=Actibacterium sp. 188UL27-1 TaxID=2786961 RepID=UPI0019586079|nr:hypothetical protein [Actibacterium sp. 188UL27-1]MBM7067731.1 hypothetical protein [Actibacterium sp. 188UL27-1]
MKTHLGLLAAGVIVLCGCAQKPEAIAPAYVSPTTYQSFGCSALRAEAVRVDNALARASAQQNKARQNDTVGVILLGLPTASLSGSNVADQVASLKGQKQTIRQTQIRKRCIRG